MANGWHDSPGAQAAPAPRDSARGQQTTTAPSTPLHLKGHVAAKCAVTPIPLYASACTSPRDSSFTTTGGTPEAASRCCASAAATAVLPTQGRPQMRTRGCVEHNNTTHHAPCATHQICFRRTPSPPGYHGSKFPTRVPNAGGCGPRRTTSHLKSAPCRAYLWQR